MTMRGQKAGPVTESELASIERLQEQLDATERVLALGSKFVEGDALDNILTDVVDAAIAIAKADFGNIQLVDPKSHHLRIVAQKGFPQWWIDFWHAAPEGTGSCGIGRAERARVVVEDVERSEIFAGTPALDIQLRAGVRAVQSTPLIAKEGRLLGMFSTHYRQPYRPDEDALRLLDMLARQVAGIVEAARLREERAERDARYRAAIETAIDGFLMIDGGGIVQDVNEAYIKASGYVRDELIGMHISNLDAEESIEQVASRLAKIRRDGNDAVTTRHRRRDGVIWPVEVRSVFWPQAGGNAFTIVRDIGERLDVERRIIDAATSEQERIGREIHDGIGQGLTAVSLMVGSLRKRLDTSQRVDELVAIDSLIVQLSQLQREARHLARGLSPLEIGPEGLPDALEQLVESTRSASNLGCDVVIDGTPPRLDPVVGLHLYRIAQEALGNALRHARASHIRVLLQADEAMLCLSVSDDGVGLSATRSKGVGLSILGYRARSIGAHLMVEMRSSGGTRVECQLPLRIALE